MWMVLPRTAWLVGRQLGVDVPRAQALVAAVRRRRRDVGWLPWVVGFVMVWVWTAVLALPLSVVLSSVGGDDLPEWLVARETGIVLVAAIYLGGLWLGIWSGGLFRCWMVVRDLRRIGGGDTEGVVGGDA